MSTWAIVQARTGSSRLPGKVLERLAGDPVITHVVRRARAIEGVDRVIVATTIERDDDVVQDVVRSSFTDVDVVRGPVADVLARFVLALGDEPPDYFVRITSDNPLLSFEHAGTMRKLVVAEGVDGADAHHAETGITTGFATEVYRTSVLLDAHERADEPRDREHVTTWIKRNENYHILYPPPEQDLVSAFRLTIDYPEDLEVVRAVYETLYEGDLIPSEAAITFLRNNPDVAATNAHCEHHVVR